MIGADTNVVLRYLLRDDEAQHAAALGFFSERTRDDPAFVSIVTLVEVAWTLRSRYKVRPDALAVVIRQLLSTTEIVMQSSDVVRRALADASEHGTDFADAVIAHLGIGADCDYTVTFDKRAAELPGVLLLQT